LKTTSEKLAQLKESLAVYKKVAIAFSGGVDSTFLLKVAHDVLGDNAIAITAQSLVVPKREYDFTKEFTKTNEIKQTTFVFDELSNKDFTNNSPDRCYYCKKAILEKMISLAELQDIKIILDGSNMDDDKDFRPGGRAITELGVISPLKDAKLTKAEIRELSKELNLPTWDKPSNACYASRFPYDEEITKEKLKRVTVAEDFLLDLGMKQVRVRSHGEIARIEIVASDYGFFLREEMRLNIDTRLKKLGFKYVTLDLLGYETGSMNRTLNSKKSK
jgi:uncharacterized protein